MESEQKALIQFQEEHPSIESYWRSVILFGRNVASYKFALAESLLELASEKKTEITLDELAVPFSKNICKHIAESSKQGTSASSRFLDVCSKYNDGFIGKDELLSTTVQLGFNNVIDAFHIVNNQEIPEHFYEQTDTGRNRRIILTDNIYKLKEQPFSENYMHETEARWKLVETAWEMNVSRNLLNVQYSDKDQILFIDSKLRRKDVTSARDALNGYQKGKCFYCFDDISVDICDNNLCDVDHFFPHILQPYMPNINLDGIWNLVLACSDCNRGTNGKFARVPELKYLERLSKRNEFLISSHHPLRETLMNQTGNTPEARHDFLQQVYNSALQNLLFTWSNDQKGEAVF